jgi:hypothetical protein
LSTLPGGGGPVVVVVVVVLVEVLVVVVLVVVVPGWPVQTVPFSEKLLGLVLVPL